MSKSPSRHPAIPYLGGTLIWAYMSVLSHTMRWKVEGAEHLRSAWEGAGGYIVASWHSRMLIMPFMKISLSAKWARPAHPLALMVSNSKDGEFSNRSGALMKLHIIRGSAPTEGKGKTEGKRGFEAAREAMQVMKKGGGVVVTIDGPRGPPEKVGIGAIKLAQQMNAPIICYGISAHGKRLDTWDRLIFPKPFARAAAVFSPPIPTSKDMDSEELRQRVEHQLKTAIARADELAGQTDTALAPAKAAPAAMVEEESDTSVGSPAMEQSSP